MEIRKNQTLGAYEIHAKINDTDARVIAALYDAQLWKSPIISEDGSAVIMRSHGKPNLDHMIEAILDKEPRTA